MNVLVPFRLDQPSAVSRQFGHFEVHGADLFCVEGRLSVFHRYVSARGELRSKLRSLNRRNVRMTYCYLLISSNMQLTLLEGVFY